MKWKNTRMVVLVLIVGTVCTLLGMLENIRPYVSKPADRYYTGLQGFVDDYIGYVSYVKEGMYGKNTFRIRSLPPPQTPTTAQLVFIYMGKIGALFGFSAPFSYHLFRALFGIGFFLSIYVLLRIKFVPQTALAVTTVTAVTGQLGWYLYEQHTWVYKTLASFGFTDNIALRFASRPHYLVGAMLFCIISTIHIKNSKKRFTIGSVFLLSLLLGTIHPSFGVILGFISVCMIMLSVIKKRKLSVLFSSYTAGIAGLFIGLLASYWSTHQYPYTSMLAFEAYVTSEKLSLDTIFGDVISFGPTLWLGLPTLVIIVLKKRGTDKIDRYMLIWLLVQLGIFFIAYKYFRSERVRYIQSLYFIPMTYGTIRLFQIIAAAKKQIFSVLVIGLFVISIPGYTNGLQQSMYYHTNYQNYSYFIFPTKNIMQAYAWLDKNTPIESVVLASWEAANNIIMYSHNYVIGNKQGWPADTGNQMERQKDLFFAGVFSLSEAEDFLRRYNIQYVYNGYQESDAFLSYDLTQELYKNPEVTIYKVK